MNRSPARVVAVQALLDAGHSLGDLRGDVGVVVQGHYLGLGGVQVLVGRLDERPTPRVADPRRRGVAAEAAFSALSSSRSMLTTTASLSGGTSGPSRARSMASRPRRTSALTATSCAQTRLVVGTGASWPRLRFASMPMKASFATKTVLLVAHRDKRT
jgi:hypothetical protein